MKTEDIRRLAKALQQVAEKTMVDPVDPKQAKGKFADRKDKDIDNDGDTDNSDKYLHNRRKAITKSVEKDTATTETKKEAADLDNTNVDKALKHDCATHVTSEQWGAGQCIKGMHTIEETADGEGVVTHYDVMFEHGIEHDVPVSELTVVRSESHMHSRKKKMEMSSKEKMKRGLYNSTNEQTEEVVEEQVNESMIEPQAYSRPNSVLKMKEAMMKIWSEAADLRPFKAKDRGERGTHMKGATEPEAIDSKASGKEKEFTKMHGGLGQKTPPDIVNEPAIDATNFTTMAKSTKQAPKRNGDNTQGDKMQAPVDTTKG